jgi:hypothetical protein
MFYQTSAELKNGDAASIYFLVQIKTCYCLTLFSSYPVLLNFALRSVT